MYTAAGFRRDRASVGCSETALDYGDRKIQPLLPGISGKIAWSAGKQTRIRPAEQETGVNRGSARPETPSSIFGCSSRRPRMPQTPTPNLPTKILPTKIR